MFAMTLVVSLSAAPESQSAVPFSRSASKLVMQFPIEVCPSLLKDYQWASGGQMHTACMLCHATLCYAVLVLDDHEVL